ncbi:Cellobiose 2-epimerase [Poriferisphaera corsica]|uniref:Cellobiose 2-epimerase n=1 Tax=Poriferisphaera corsica TaxID=2528020 RepID=A0A517YPC4_9BACT|nr:AGE family epimerase/isomerase [Poriferisphaera corsica]QDU32069.1 Cellobiose 2-epimerase [Poriferisphaera corsica]
MEKSRLESLLGIYKGGLIDDVLPFWLKHSLDHEYGGFMTCVDRDGSLLDTDKGGWQQGRAIWTYANMWNFHEQKPEYLDAAKLSMRFMDENMFDSDGRMFFQLTKDGKPIRKRRYTFTETFGAIASASFARATGNDFYADRARNLIDLILKYNNTPGLVEPKFTGVRPAKGIGTPMIMMATCQELRAALDTDEWDDLIMRCIDEIEKDFVKPELEVCMEQVSPEGEIIEHIDGQTLNPGHAIEASWFILHEARYRNNDKRLIDLGLNILNWMWARGIDKEFGGLMYFVGLNGKPVQEYWQDMKFWWPHNEAIIATLYAYAMTGEKKYAEMHQQVHDWAYKFFPDAEHGDWFGYLRRDGQISQPSKGNIFKGPFHLPRMQLMCWKLCEDMLAGKFDKVKFKD